MAIRELWRGIQIIEEGTFDLHVERGGVCELSTWKYTASRRQVRPTSTVLVIVQRSSNYSMKMEPK